MLTGRFAMTTATSSHGCRLNTLGTYCVRHQCAATALAARERVHVVHLDAPAPPRPTAGA
jgi:hypothetical protein